MNKKILAALGLFLTLLQVFLSRQLAIRAVAPDLPLVFLVFTALYYGEYLTWPAAFLMGLFKDFYFYGMPGLMTAFYLLLIYIVGKNRNYFFNRNLNVILIITLLATFVFRVYLLLFSFILESFYYRWSWSGLVIQMVYNTALSFLLFSATRFDWRRVLR